MRNGFEKHPKVNSTWREDSILINHHVNIGVAVAVEDGLVVPVLRFTDAMSLSQIGGNVETLPEEQKIKITTYRDGRKYLYRF
jgi:pyruvate dehydrogenase E2 component (dihydrolipoamide acetyltransferase)